MNRLEGFPGRKDLRAWSVHASLTLGQDRALEARFEIEGPIAELRVPEGTPAQSASGARVSGTRRDELWKSTCFEIFLKGSGTAYTEFNISPSGDWAIYEFDDYRKGMRNSDGFKAPRVLLTRSDRKLSIEIVIASKRTRLRSASTEAALSAVLEHQDGEKTYWALVHRSAQPDFHNRDSFLVRI